jgi:hypothetical protein
MLYSKGLKDQIVTYWRPLETRKHFNVWPCLQKKLNKKLRYQ